MKSVFYREQGGELFKRVERRRQQEREEEAGCEGAL